MCIWFLQYFVYKIVQQKWLSYRHASLFFLDSFYFLGTLGSMRGVPCDIQVDFFIGIYCTYMLYMHSAA